jgi:hypothetical protein
MESEQGQDGWDEATNTLSSSCNFNNEDYSIKTLGDEENLEDPEEMQRRWAAEEREREDPFNYTPWIAALPMPFTKEIEQGLRVSGLKLRKQIQADIKRNPCCGTL